MKGYLVSIWFAILVAFLGWILVRLTFGAFYAEGVSDLPILVASFFGAGLFEIGLRTMPKDAKAKPEIVRTLTVMILASLLAISYTVIVFVHPGWLHDSASAVERMRSSLEPPRGVK